MTAAAPFALSERIYRILSLDPAAPAMEFERQWYRWADLAASARGVTDYVSPGERVAVLLRNHPAHVGLVLGLLQAGACVVTVNPGRGIDRVRTDLAGLGAATIAGTSDDLATFAPPAEHVRRLTSDRLGAVLVSGERAMTDPPTALGVAVEMLTSGTTGPPKRVPLTYQTFSRVMAGAKHYEGSQAAELRLRTGVAVINAPLVHLSGLFRVIQCVSDGRSFALLERFQLQEWLEAVRRHQPRTVSLVPAALRTVLHADLDPRDLASVRSVVSGTAPLSADDADAFFSKYGIPVLISYAATEFGGGVAGWNLPDHQRYWTRKRGSVGRAHAGCELQVVDQQSGAPVPPDTPGLLEVRARQLGDDLSWNRTTDLARIDADGFVWILGRADQAIIRGGFKVLPDDVRAALEGDPRVRGAAVVGIDDARLGAVPVAVVELHDDGAPPAAEDLLEQASKVLSRYELPTSICIVEALPRTPSGKVDLPAVRALLAEGG